MYQRIGLKKMRQRLTTYLTSDRICMFYVEFSTDRVSTVANICPQRLPPFPRSSTNPKGFHHYRDLGHTVLDTLIDHKDPSNHLKRKLDSILGRQTDMHADRQLELARCVRRRTR